MIDAAEVRRILTALGNRESKRPSSGPIARETSGAVEVVPPSWRRDLTREIDLVEEVARIHGYDTIPEDVNVPMAASHRTERDRVLGKIREVLISAGVDEAMTISLVEPKRPRSVQPVDRFAAAGIVDARVAACRSSAAEFDSQFARGTAKQ